MGFEQILGQDLLVGALQKALQQGEIGHAYLFTGPPGSGKKTLAFLFAQALNCTASNPPCGECLSCRKTKSGNHPNLYHVRPQGASIKIEQLRELKESFFYLPSEGRKKVCLLYDADCLTLPAGNSLLKILEEPPEDLVFILLSSRPWILLPTILSRCAHFPLRPLPDEGMARLLEEKKTLGDRERELIISLAEGNPGRALEMLSQESWREKLQESQALLERLEHCPEEELLPCAEELSRRDDLQQIISAFLLILRRRLLFPRISKEENDALKLTGSWNNSSGYDYAGERLPGAKVSSGINGMYHLERTCHALLRLQGELLGNVNRRLALEAFLLTMRGVV